MFLCRKGKYLLPMINIPKNKKYFIYLIFSILHFFYKKNTICLDKTCGFYSGFSYFRIKFHVI